jgi:hypothetical protein
MPDNDALLHDLQAPQLSLMFFNDLRHLADTLLLLPACFGPELGPLISPEGTTNAYNGGLGGVGPGGAALAGHAAPNFLQDALLLRSEANEVLRNQVMVMAGLLLHESLKMAISDTLEMRLVPDPYTGLIPLR